MKDIQKPRSYSTHNSNLERQIDALLESAGGSLHDDLLRDIIVTALKIREDAFERGDVRLMTTALKEIRYALNVFYPYRHVRKVAIFGSARTPSTDANYKLTSLFAKKITEYGWMVVTGAASGIMQAGNEGAGREKSFGVNIRLPFEQAPNPVIANDHKLVNFKYFFTRKLIFIRESDATVLFPGGFGTHDEGFETLTLIQTGKTAPRPVVCIDSPKSTYWKSWRNFISKELGRRKMIDSDDLNLIFYTHSADEAARYVSSFYRNFHSGRYIEDRLIFRIKQPLEPARLVRINKDFKGILKKGKIEQYLKPFPEEENEPHTFGLARLALFFNRRHFGTLNRLIHAINEGF